MTGTWHLIRLILRRDRVLLPLWTILIGLIPASYVSAFQSFFATDAERVAYARESAANTGFVGLYGPLHGTGLGELVAWRAGFIPVIVGLCALLTIVRHTATDEEAGRTELVGSTVVGRSAQLAAALIATCGASLVLGLVMFGALASSGLPAGGSFAMGAEFTLSGWAFAGVAAVTAQLSGGARGARFLAVGVLAFSYATRLAGDASAVGDGRLSWLAWISPLGWATHILPYDVGTRPLPMLLLLAFAVLTVTGGVLLRGRRDLGAGLLPDRLGSPTAGRVLGSPIGLAWRLHRGPLAAWTACFALLGLLFGGVGDSVLQIAATNGEFTEILEKIGGSAAMVDSYFGSVTGLVGLIVACYAVQATLRMRDEEQTGHVEAVLSTATSRWAWAGSHLLFALLGPAVALLANGLAAGFVYGHGEQYKILGSIVVQLPAVWVIAAVAVLLFGLLPGWAPVSWGAPALCLLLLLLGPLLKLNHWVMDVNPFTHTPKLPATSFPATPLVSLTIVAAVVLGAGLVALRRRNVPA